MRPLTLRPPKKVHDERREDRNETAVEHAIDERKDCKPKESRRGFPHDQRKRHTHKHDHQQKLAPHTVGHTPEKKAPSGAPDTDHTQKQDSRRLRDAVIHCVRNKMNERDK